MELGCPNEVKTKTAHGYRRSETISRNKVLVGDRNSEPRSGISQKDEEKLTRIVETKSGRSNSKYTSRCSFIYLTNLIRILTITIDHQLEKLYSNVFNTYLETPELSTLKRLSAETTLSNYVLVSKDTSMQDDDKY